MKLDSFEVSKDTIFSFGVKYCLRGLICDVNYCALPA